MSCATLSRLCHVTVVPGLIKISAGTNRLSCAFTSTCVRPQKSCGGCCARTFFDELPHAPSANNDRHATAATARRPDVIASLLVRRTTPLGPGSLLGGLPASAIARLIASGA